jgi:hypothetical protein
MSDTRGPHGSGATNSGNSVGSGAVQSGVGVTVAHDWFCCCIYCLQGHH